ncbi:serine hydrolase domain-containing protein [Phenylobacterium sp.]|jgi:CubicO group peptidase (beta-lactamase class C family)|uniref:serine hydrolase domain-containing protein n=1 Tax=Phenylobacterium sp. TaxID=1871053 RepID=UPI002F3F6EC7
MKPNVLACLFALSILAPSARGAELAPQQGEFTPKVDAIFKDYVGQPGCNVGVVRAGKLILERSYGLADVANSLPLTPETRFDIGSVSKQFTAAAILILADQGKISLDDDIHKYVPELPSYGVKVSLRQMLHHTSGIMDANALLRLSGWVYGDAISERDELWALSRMPTLNFAPGTRESYSNGNYLLLGLVVNRVSGQPLGAYLQSTIFGPLGMTHTVLTGDHTVVEPHMAQPYAFVDGSPHLFANRIDSVGYGGIVTTVGDLALWERNFDEPKAGGAKVMAEMVTVEPLADGSDNNYAGGVEVDSYRGLRTIEHDGANAGFVSYKVRFPGAGLSFIGLCNRRDLDNLTQKLDQVADLYLGLAPEGPQPREASDPASQKWPATDLATLSGPYLRAGRWGFHIFRSENGGLLDESGAQYDRIGRFEFKDASGTTWSFVLEHGVATAVKRTIPGSKTAPVRYERRPPPQSNLREYAGMYVSPELATAWCIEAAEKGLVLRRKRFEDETVQPAWFDAFAMEGTALFDRVTNQIAGFTLRSDRLSGGVRFVKAKHEGACTPY